MIASLYAFQADSGPVMELKSSFDSIQDYTCILESFIRKGDKTEERTYEYRYMKPGWVYMKILEGDNKGAVVIYNPKTEKVRARKGGILGSIKLTFDPTDKKVLSIRGHRVDESHIGAILNRWLATSRGPEWNSREILPSRASKACSSRQPDATLQNTTGRGKKHCSSTRITTCLS